MTRLSVTVIPVADHGQEPEVTKEVAHLYPERNISIKDKALIPSFVKKSLTSLKWLLFASDEREVNISLGLEAPEKTTTKATPSESSTSAYTQARRTIPPPTKVKKEAPAATKSKQGKKKSPAKAPLRKGERSSQRLKRTFCSTKRPEGASSKKPITLSDKEGNSEDNEPISKRLKTGGTSNPATRKTSPSSSATSSSIVPSPPPSTAHSSPPPVTQQPSPRQQEGEGMKETDAAPAAEEQVAEQEAQPQKNLDKGKGILVESPKMKKPIVPRQLSLGGPLSCPIICPDTSGDEAIVRSLAEEEGLEVPLLMEEQTTTAPSSSKIQEVAIRQAPEGPPASGNINQKKKKPSSPIPAIPIGSRRKSQIGIAELFEMMGKKIEKLLPETPSVPQINMTDTTEELKAIRNGMDQLSSAINKFQEQQRTEREQLLNTIKDNISSIRAAPSAPTLQAVRDEIKKVSESLQLAYSLHNTRAELQLKKLLKNSEERTETKEALKAFGRYLEGKIT
ncbi:flocculation protein FLO11-like [Gastrolobium bilobum]|uniref:flocculation protein FLO11-like n=1 Tax=Gastrolobium bilobum TaxID=150636 RepID=UPI002AB19BF2|nr:flocculation protein FLO11-like [Gastrolobium bilobum]